MADLRAVCQFCDDLAEDPHMIDVSNCKHVFCKVCITEREFSLCPRCSAAFSVTLDLKAVNDDNTQPPSPKVNTPVKSSRPHGAMTASDGEEERPYKKTRLVTSLDETTTLAIGKQEDPKTLIVHKNILCSASPFFEAACKPEWLKAGDVITLPVDDPQAVQIMINWMYQNELCLPDEEMYMSATILLCVKIYVLGQKYQMPRLRNDALDALYDYTDWGLRYYLITPEVLIYAWQNTSASCPLRCLLLMLIRLGFASSHLETMRGKIGSMEFWTDLAIDLLDSHDEQDKSLNKELWWGPFCSRYHIHEKGFRGCNETKDVTWYTERND